MASKRISDEPAYVLHRYDWSESSLIVEVLTRHHGRIALVAKGAKRPSSHFRPILLPLQPLLLSYSGETEVHTLKSAEWMGGHVMPTGEALLSGYYLNELLMQLTARDDPHPMLFDFYAAVVQLLASEKGEMMQAALRAFELLLLREIGLLPQLDLQTLTLAPLQLEAHYCLVPEGGLRVSAQGDRARLSGAQWMAVQQALQTDTPLWSVMRACSLIGNELKPQLRALLHYHCGVPALRTRQLMLDIQNL